MKLLAEKLIRQNGRMRYSMTREPLAKVI